MFSAEQQRESAHFKLHLFWFLRRNTFSSCSNIEKFFLKKSYKENNKPNQTKAALFYFSSQIHACC